MTALPDGGRPIVTVRGEARLEAAPDLATINVTVHSAGDSADQARAELAEAAVSVREVLQQFDDEIERSSTTGLQIAPVFNRRSATKITGYRGRFSTEVVVDDLEALSLIVLALTQVANSEIDGPWWSLRRDNPLYRRVRVEAIGDARRRADDYAAAVGATVSSLIEISDVEAGFAGPGVMRAMAFGAEAADASAFEFEPALQEVSGQVVVRYAISA
jgi:hypothetical protein